MLARIAFVYGSWLLLYGWSNAYGDPTPFDKEKAKRALRDIGADIEGSTYRCAGCHDPNIVKINEWVTSALILAWRCDLAQAFQRSTDTSPAFSAKQKINCLRSNPEDSDSSFSAHKLGLLSAGAHSGFFRSLFQEAYEPHEIEAQFQRFVTEAGMPKTPDKLSEDSFRNILEWMSNSNEPAPYLEDILGGDVNAPSQCQPYLSDEMRTYVKRRATDSWMTRNAEQGMRMFACDQIGADPKTCFTQKHADGKDVFPVSKALANADGWTADYHDQTIRLLVDLGFKTSYWTRTSADGRFIGNGDAKGRAYNRPGIALQGDSFSARITDLKAVLDPSFTRKDIKVKANFDPSFLPDNSGFLFQGSKNGFCHMGILENPSTTSIDFTEVGCVKREGIQLYQSIGGGLYGSDFYAVTGNFEGDNGLGGVVEHPTWLKKSYMFMNRIIHNGLDFEVQTAVSKWTPFKGDFQMSPSTELVASRVAGLVDKKFVQMGYSIERMNFDANILASSNRLESTELAKLCTSGGKATFSYSERFLVTYDRVRDDHFAEFGFASKNDPNFIKIIGTHNIYLTDLYNGVTRRITRMSEGQHAKFPHFRSDGWLYFLVHDGSDRNLMFATDAALRIISNF